MRAALQAANRDDRSSSGRPQSSGVSDASAREVASPSSEEMLEESPSIT